jgi:hypothetical protein
MAKRSTPRPQAQADDAAAPAPAQPKPRRSRTASATPAESDTVAARPAAGAVRPADAGPDARSASMASEPSEEDIRVRAYQRYLQRGGGHGLDFDDWLHAERELKANR